MSIFDYFNPPEPDYGPTPDELQNFWQVQDRYAAGPPGAPPMGGSPESVLPEPGSTWQDRFAGALSQVQFPQSRRPNAVGGFLQGLAGGFTGANMADQRFRAGANERTRLAAAEQNRERIAATEKLRERQMRASLAGQMLRARRAEKAAEMATKPTPEQEGEIDARKIAARDAALRKRGVRVPGTPIPKVYTGTPGRVIPSLSALSNRVGRDINFALQRGNSAVADSLNTVKATVDDAHAKLREAQSAADVDAAEDKIDASHLPPAVVNELLRAGDIRRKQLGNAR